MKVSDLKLEDANYKFYQSSKSVFLVELPKYDGCAVIDSEESKARFIAEHGDQEIILDEYMKIYKVPAFAEGREEYSRKKQIECNYWGCE